MVKNGVRNRIKNNLIRCPCYRMFYSDYNNWSSPTDCPYHEFKNSNHRDVSVGKSTKQIIDKLYGNKEQENKLLDFLENE